LLILAFSGSYNLIAPPIIPGVEFYFICIETSDDLINIKQDLNFVCGPGPAWHKALYDC